MQKLARRAKYEMNTSSLAPGAVANRRQKRQNTIYHQLKCWTLIEIEYFGGKCESLFRELKFSFWRSNQAPDGAKTQTHDSVNGIVWNSVH